MSNKAAPEIKYDVFVSFRGQDIRDGFLSHLIDTFERKKINFFVDYNLEKGDEIWPSLVGAIRGSLILLVIFSPDYASSCWCLEELVKILECREEYGRIVIPVFYHIQPTHVRHQLGSYAEAFAVHGRKQMMKVQHWRHALNKSADLAGIDSSKFPNDAAVLNEIVDLVLKRLVKPHVISKGLVGIEEKITTVESWIRKEPKDNLLIGIWGMGGIGKTTLAEEIFNKLQYEYEGCYFLANEREESKNHGIISLKKRIFSGLLRLRYDDVEIYTENSLPDNILRRIGHMKVLIVLDDVSDSDHLGKLLGTLDNFGSGSRILVTTRDEQVLKAKKVKKTYHLTELSFDKTLELFNLNAFNQSDRQKEYYELSLRVVNYAKGIPLVVKVLAGLLHGKNKEEWESLLDKLKKIPPTKVYEVMKLSYDGLDRKEQQIFLDLACFFLRSNIMVNTCELKSLLKDTESDNSVFYALERLKDKALITISEDNYVSMHDSLQEMAWEIIRRESSIAGSHSRLWDSDDIAEALKNGKNTEDIRSLQIDMRNLKKQKLSHDIFTNMSKLQFLKISGKYNDDLLNILAEGLQFLETELRFLYWDYYPLKSLPENFIAKRLVILEFPFGRMKKLWDGVQNLVNLKKVDLTSSNKLEELPDLSGATNLEELKLGGCSMLTSVHPSIFSLPKLKKLFLINCKSLTIVTSDSKLCSLSHLYLLFCENLREFSLISDNMKELRLGWTNVRALPSSFGYQSKLKSLDLRRSKIEKLPSSINNLTQLLHLDIRYCRELQTIPELPMFLEILDAECCTSLQTLPELPRFLKTLNIRECKSLLTLPVLPLFLKTLDASECISLKTVLLSPSTAVEQLKENSKRILFWNCLNLNIYSLAAIGQNAQTNVMKFAGQHLSTPNHHHVENYSDYKDNYGSYQAVYAYPASNVPPWLEYKTRNDYIIIDLSSAPPSPLLGFIFGFVFGESTDMNERREVNITISDVKGKGKRETNRVRMYIDYGIGKIISDQVCVIYDQRCSDFLKRRAENQTSFIIQVTIQAQWAVDPGLKEFGVSPISTLTYKSFIDIEEMELHDSD
ncbi:hypothetical protein AAZX31_09G054100 [Glycine max]